ETTSSDRRRVSALPRGGEAEPEELRRGPDAQLPHDVRAMKFDRLRGDEELFGDSPAGLRLENAIEHRAFTVAQMIEALALAAGRDREPLLSVEGEADALEQRGVVERLFDEIECALLHRGDRHRHVAVPGDEDDGDALAAPHELVVERGSRHSRHADVEHEASRRP